MKLFSSLSPFLSLSPNLFMKDPKSSNSRKLGWYERLVEMANIWRRGISKSTNNITNPSFNITLWRSISKSTKQTKKITSLNLVTRVCLCTPVSSFNENFQAEFPPRKSHNSHSHPRPKPLMSATPRLSDVDRPRRVFRGKSLTDDVSMRKFVVEEEAMMQVRRRNQMEVIKRRSVMRREKLGPSPLSKMIMAQEDQQ